MPFKDTLRKYRKGLSGLPYLLRGYSYRLDGVKIDLIRRVFEEIRPGARSFADLGGVWRVDAGYTRYTVNTFDVDRGVIVDTDYPDHVARKLDAHPKITRVHDSFGSPETVRKVGPVDVVYLFDVLLHQVDPDWDEILRMYAEICPCFVVFNQQFTRGTETLRLLDLPYEEYVAVAPPRTDDVYRYIYDHMSEIHPQYGKPMRDIHNIWQWGIVDADLRRKMAELGYEEKLYENHGRFSSLEHFENHAFVFARD